MVFSERQNGELESAIGGYQRNMATNLHSSNIREDFTFRPYTHIMKQISSTLICIGEYRYGCVTIGDVYEFS